MWGWKVMGLEKLFSRPEKACNSIGDDGKSWKIIVKSTDVKTRTK